MSYVHIDILETLQRTYQKVSEHLNKAKAGSSDADVQIKKLSFNVGKKEREYNISMEMDFTLLPKAENEKSSQVT